MFRFPRSASPSFLVKHFLWDNRSWSYFIVFKRRLYIVHLEQMRECLQWKQIRKLGLRQTANRGGERKEGRKEGRKSEESVPSFCARWFRLANLNGERWNWKYARDEMKFRITVIFKYRYRVCSHLGWKYYLDGRELRETFTKKEKMLNVLISRVKYFVWNVCDKEGK